MEFWVLALTAIVILIGSDLFSLDRSGRGRDEGLTDL